MTEFNKRLITACVATPLLLVFIIKSNVFAFSLALGTIILFTSLELSSLFRFNRIHRVWFVSVICIGIILSLKFKWYFEYYFLSLTCVWIVFSLILFGAVIFFNNSASYIDIHKLSKPPVFLFFIIGWFLMIPFGVYFIYLRQVILSNVIYILALFFEVWAVDIGSYAVGKLAGKNKLIQNVSPGKTTEGLIGGVISLYIVTAMLYYGSNIIHQNSVLIWFFVSSVVCVFAVFGDLVESMLKRIMNVKDSGCILPGHGGFFDRFDSLLAVLPVYCFCLILFNCIQI